MNIEILHEDKVLLLVKPHTETSHSFQIDTRIENFNLLKYKGITGGCGVYLPKGDWTLVNDTKKITKSELSALGLKSLNALGKMMHQSCSRKTDKLVLLYKHLN